MWCDLPDAVLRILPRGRRLHSVGQGPRHYGGSGPWFSRRRHGRLFHGHYLSSIQAWPDFREVPEPLSEEPFLDIDVDFDPEGRARVIEYCGEKYGN